MDRRISGKNYLVDKCIYGFLLIIICFILENKVAASEKITVSFNNITLSEAIQKLENISGYSFAYQSDILPKTHKVSCSFKNASINAILDKILKGTGITYQILDKHIVMKKKSKRKKYTLSGYVGDSKTGQKLINANVFDKDSKLGTITNNYGYYSISLEEGIYDIAFSYIGMEKKEEHVVFDSNKQLNIDLLPNLEIAEIVITSEEQVPLIEKGAAMGKMTISPVQMAKFPVLMAETDLVKYIQLLPGMQSGMEANGALYVRGGNSSQNLFLLDNIPLYNSYHLLGLFSVFNADMIGKTEVYKGAFPAGFGGRLSSVIDMKTKDGNFKKLKGKVSLGMISSKLFLEGPLVKDQTSFALSGRFGYYYLYGVFLPKALTDGDNIENYYFTDITAKLTHKFSNNSKIYATFYNGIDFGETTTTTISSDTEEYKFLERKDGQEWFNTIGTLGWAGKITNKLFSNIQVTVSNYNYYSYLNDSTYNDDNNYVFTTFESNIVENDILNKSIISDFECEINPKLKINFGYNYSQLTLTSENAHEDSYNNAEDLLASYRTDTTINYYKHNTEESKGYISLEIMPVKSLYLSAGVHASFYSTGNYTNNSFQPRATINWKFLPGFSLKGAYSQMGQHLHYLETSKIKRASDLLVAAVAGAPSETSEQFSTGLGITKLKGYNFHIEAYYKKMDNLINYKEGASFFSQSDSWVEKIVTGTGESKGVELLVEKPFGKFTGWAGYTISESTRQFDGINMGQPFPFRFEHRHHFNILAKYQISDKLSVAANWLFHTGNKETIPETFYWSTNKEFDKKMDIDDYSMPAKVMYNPKNGYKNPNYHRLDLSVNYTRKNRFGAATWCLSIYNLYNRINVYSSFYNEKYAHFIGNVSYIKRVIQENKFFGTIPSISYTLSF